ncbi:MAG: ABC transporter ATP-binding protein [Cytophagales bacterium]|nr:ABC transporter ATP-binding protein [Cytophagales bacterium]
MELAKDVLLHVNGLVTEFQSDGARVKAVNEVSFSIKKGETIGIVGESGSGKSVTSLSIMGLIPNPPGKVVNGQVYFRSQRYGQVLDLTQVSPDVMSHIRGEEMSMIFQEPMTSLNPVFTCGDQVSEVLRLHLSMSRRQARQRTIALFDEVQLPRPEKIYDSYPHNLSGGQKQRVMIAMCMACRPSLLIADEPTTALDVTVQARILQLMKTMREEHHTAIIFITHDLGVIAEIADRILVMYRGQIVEQGTVWDIFDRPQHPYTKGLLACRPRLDVRLKVLPTVSDFMDTALDGRLSEKKSHKYNSVGEAILFSAESDEEFTERQEQLRKKAPILRVEKLSTYFPVNESMFGKARDYIKAVEDVSFEVYPGETLGLVGESGCGKTTLGRSILRLVEPNSGHIYFEGKDLRQLGKREMRLIRKDMQIIFQDPYASLNPRMTIGEAIMEPMRIHGVLANDKERKHRVIQLLERVNLLGRWYDRYPHEFSGGQRQRICVARALALNPKFIVCDESVSALDVSVQAQVLNLLTELREEFKITYIFISHDLSVVKFISDRVIVMNKGQIVEEGYPNELYEKPKENYTRELIRAIPKGSLEDIRKAQLQRSSGIKI